MLEPANGSNLEPLDFIMYFKVDLKAIDPRGIGIAVAIRNSHEMGCSCIHHRSFGDLGES